MRKFGIIIVVGIFIGSFVAFQKGSWSGASRSIPVHETKEPSNGSITPASKPQAILAQPKRIQIPAIEVDALIESVGLDEKRSMDVPKVAENAAWYNLGHIPGENGNAVIAGHFDAPDGSPAVFYKLKELQPAQEIIVTDIHGNELIFVVSNTENYDFDTFPIPTIFGEGDTPRLNLITCDGIFNKETQNYSQRTVVFAQLKGL